MKKRFIFLVAIVGSLNTLTIAQSQGVLHYLSEEEQSAIEAIALYPQEQRAAVLEASLHPEILVRMESIKRNTESQYKKALGGLAEEDQKRIYNLSRYPELIGKLCERDKEWPNKDIEALVVSYPEDIQVDAIYINRKYFETLKEVEHLYKDADEAFTVVLSTYPEDVRSAYEELAKLPGVVSILTDNMSMTVLLGDIYKSNPVQLARELDSLNVIVAEQQAKDVSAWKQELEENPEAMHEYEQAAQEFAQDQGYDDQVYPGPAPDVYADKVYVDYIWTPYPYWFGYPYWYAYPCWYPYPYWYHWGYYYGPGNVIFVVGLPSSFFISWTFYYDDHFYHYPHFTDEVIGHYYGPRHGGAGNQPVIREWEEAHRSELPAGWFNDDKNRVMRIQEYGKFKMDYDQTVRASTDQAPTQREFLKDNAEKYPTLKPVLRDKPVTNETPTKKFREYEPMKEDLPEKYVPREKVIEREKAPVREEIDRAKESHQNTWDRLRSQPGPSQQRSPQQSAPSRSAPPPRTQPPPSQPRKKN